MCGYENTWSHQGWGESKIGLTFKTTNNHIVRMGGKIEMVTYVDHVFAILFVHLHKIHNYPDNFKAKVTNEVSMIIDNFEHIVVGYPNIVYVKKYMILNQKYCGTTTYPKVIYLIFHVRSGLVLSCWCGVTGW